MKKNSGILTFFLSIFIFGFLIFKPAFSQNASLLPNAVQQFFDSNGNPLSGGKIYFYQVGTSTFKDVYNSSAATIPYTNPITLNAGGKPPGSSGIYGIGLYRQLVKDKNGNTIWDAVTAPGGGGGGTPTNVGDGNAVGTVLPWSGLIAPSQYVFTYGQELVRTDYPEFFTAITLQTNVICTSSSNILTGISDTSQIPIGASVELALCVPPGSTVVSKTSGTVTLNNSANISLNTTARFFPYGNGNGSTTFNVPDLRDMTLVGRPNMGGIDRGLITSQYFGVNPAGLGAAGGSQNHTQTISEMAMHTHDNILTDPGHTHGVPGYSDETSNEFIAAGGISQVVIAQTMSAATGISLHNVSAGASDPFTIIQPSITFNYIIKVIPDILMSTETVVTKLEGMTGVISCGIGLTCDNQTVSVNSFGEATTAIKIPVRVATTTNIGLFGNQTIDEVMIVAGDRVLVKDQIDAKENGIYVASNSNWTRATDFNENTEITRGTLIYVNEGKENENHQYSIITTNPQIGLPLNFKLTLGFIQANTINASQRILQNKARDIISVADFIGLDPTGITPSTSAFQAAIDATTDGQRVKIIIPRQDNGSPAIYNLGSISIGTRIVLWEVQSDVTLTGTRLPGTIINGVFSGIGTPTTYGPYAFGDSNTIASRLISGISPLRVQRTSNHTSTYADFAGFALRVISSVGANVGNDETAISATITHGAGLGSAGQHIVGYFGQVNRISPSTASSFGANFVVGDTTGLPSSQSGAAMIGAEFTMGAADLDDSKNRIFIDVVGKRADGSIAPFPHYYAGLRIRPSDASTQYSTFDNAIIVQNGIGGGSIVNGLYMNADFTGGAAIDIDAKASALIKHGSNVSTNAATVSQVDWIGYNSSSARTAYARTAAVIGSNTAGGENGSWNIQTLRSGAMATQATFGLTHNITAYQDGVDVIRIGRNINQYISIYGSSGSNTLFSRSATSSAKVLTINATTDEINTAPAGGALGFNVQIGGVSSLFVDSSGNTQHIFNTGLGASPVTSTWTAIAAGTTAKSQINFASSIAPTSPNLGDTWFDGTYLNLFSSGSLSQNLAFVGYQQINTQISNYQLVATDKGKIIEMDMGSGNTLTIPLNSTVSFPIGTYINITQMGTGQTTLTPESGSVIIQSRVGLKLAGQYAQATLYKRDTNEWIAAGDLTP